MDRIEQLRAEAKAIDTSGAWIKLAEALIQDGQRDEFRVALARARESASDEAHGILNALITPVQRLEADAKAGDRAAEAVPVGRLFELAVVDPPWLYAFSRTRSRKVEAHYPTMDDLDLKDLKLPMAETSAIYLWAVAPRLKIAIELAEAWGYEVTTSMVWDKVKMGMGYHARGQHELILICTRGGWPPPDPHVRISSVIREERGRHSVKPEALQEYIERAYPKASKLEVFARRRRTGWAAWGYDVGASERLPLIRPLPPPEETPGELVEEGQRLLHPRF